MNERITDILCGVGAIFSYLLLNSLPIDTILKTFIPNNILTNINFVYIFNIVYELLQVIIIFIIMRKTIKRCFKDFTSNFKSYLGKYLKYWGLALALMYISNFIIIKITGNIAPNEQSVRDLFAASPIITFILAGVLAPILEESIFRLSLYKIIGNKNYNKYIFIILSGLIFGSMHVIGNVTTFTDWLYIIPYGIPGWIFAYTLVKSDNIFVPISLHAIHNNFALIMQLLATL